MNSLNCIDRSEPHRAQVLADRLRPMPAMALPRAKLHPARSPWPGLGWRKLSWALMLAWGGMVQAAPTGGVVTAGQAVLSGLPGQLTVTQSSPQAVLEWQSFGILPGESVRFVQPDSHAVVLNRVLGSEPSLIGGSLSANGQVFLINPHGVLFGVGSSVNVGGLVATTLNLSDADFLAKRYRLDGASAEHIVNQGSIRATEGGYVALLGREVHNLGTVVAQRGSVALAAGQTMTLDLTGDRLLNVAIGHGAAQALLANSGVLQADGGTVLMSTQAVGQLLANAVNNTGLLRAQTLENQQGRIVLLGSADTGTVQLGGVLDVRGGLGQTGGSVTVSAQQVNLAHAQIDASGGVGGGQVWMGGGLQGQSPALAHAETVDMGRGAPFAPTPHNKARGGQVVLWADKVLHAAGQISAQGGPQGGHGGMVETSAHTLQVQGLQVNTLAPHGQTGTWLLDPADVSIDATTTSGASPTGQGFAPDAGVGASHINVAELVTALGSSNVTVTTSNSGTPGTGLGDIQVNAAIVWTAPTTLSLIAARDVRVNQAITATGGSLALQAGRDIHVDAAVTTTTGHLGFVAVQDVALNAATTITTGHLTAVAGRDVRVTAAATVTTGNMVLRADNDGTGPGALAGTVSVTCGLACLSVTTGELSVRFNPVAYASTATEILAYGSHLTGGGTLDAKAWVFAQGAHKLYDGTANATLSGLMPDASSAAPPVALGAVSAAQFDTRHVGIAKPIVFDSVFADAAYALFAPEGTAPGSYVAHADVRVRPLSVSAVSDVRVYNGNALSDGVPTVSGLQPGDSLNGDLSQVFASKDVLGTGQSTLLTQSSYTVTDGHAGQNYSITVNTASGTITPAPLTITAQDLSKVYGQTPALTGLTTSALVNGETVGSVSLSSAGQVATAAVAGSPYPIVPSQATGGTFTPGNYNIAYVNGVLNITPAAVVPPVVVPPVIPPVVPEPEVPPVVVPPVIPPVVPELEVPPVVAPPVIPPVVPEPEVPPVVVPPVILPVVPEPEVPPVVVLPVVPEPEVPRPPESVPTHQQSDDASSPEQSLPTVVVPGVPGVRVGGVPPKPLVQGPVLFPAKATPAPQPAPPPQTPAPKVSKPLAQPGLTPNVAPVPRQVPVRTQRPPKQDRN